MCHAEGRIRQRLRELGFPPHIIETLWLIIQRAAAWGTDDLAVRVLSLPKQHMCSDTSNGNQLWAVLRNGMPVTVMLRRCNQPATPSALRVQRVVILH